METYPTISTEQQASTEYSGVANTSLSRLLDIKQDLKTMLYDCQNLKLNSELRRALVETETEMRHLESALHWVRNVLVENKP